MRLCVDNIRDECVGCGYSDGVGSVDDGIGSRARDAPWTMRFGRGMEHYDQLFIFGDHDDQLFNSATNQIMYHK